MELREKIKRAMTAEFIGDIPFDEAELEEMKRDCQCFYRQVQGTWSKIYQEEDIEELIVLIVNISKFWGDDKESRFWVKQFGEIFDDATISPNKFYDEFERALARNHKKLFLSKEGKRMFREVFLLHAFAPEQSRDSFVRLLWNWFVDEDVVGYDYQQNDPLYQKIGDFLSAKFSGETNLDEDSSFEGKTYAIRSSFKYLFTQDPENGIRLLNKLFAGFNDIYFNGRYDQESFYGEKCYEIVNKVLDEANEPIKRRRRVPTEHIVSDYKKIYAAYEIDPEGHASLFLPEIRAIDEIAEEYDFEIYNDEELVYRGSGYIVGSDLKRRIKRISIPLEEFAHKAKETFHFRVKLFVERTDGDILLYDSNSSLFREFILFKTGRETRQTTCKPDTYYVVHPYATSLDARMTTCAVRNVSTYVATIVAQDGDYLLGQTQQVFFSHRPKDSHIIIDGKESGLIYKKDGQNFPHFKKVTNLTILLDASVTPQSIGVKMAGKDKTYPLNTCSQCDGNKYIIDLSQIEGAEDGAHTLYVTDVSKQKLLHRVDYYVDRHLSVHLSCAYAFDKNLPHLSISGMSTCDESATMVSLYNQPVAYGCETVEVDHGGGVVEYRVPCIKWRMDDNEWHYGVLGSDLWKGDATLHNNCVLEVDNASTCNFSLYINKKEIALSDGGAYLLGDALTENAHNARNDIIMRIGNDSYKLFSVYNTPFLNEEFDIDLEHNTIDFSSAFCGDPSSKFHVVLSGEFHSYDFVCGIVSALENTIEDGEYTVTIHLMDFFGEDSDLLMNEEFIIGNPDKICFMHKCIALTKFKNPKGGKVSLNKTYISDIKYLREESETAVYSGTLNCQRNRYEVEVYKKSDDNLKFYFVDGDNLLPVYYDMKQNSFTKKENADTILCSSCYYTKEDF